MQKSECICIITDGWYYGFRSPGRGRNQGILNRFRAGNSKGSRLEEVKVSGPKIVSLKKDKKEKDEEVEEVKEKVEEDKADKPKEKGRHGTVRLAISLSLLALANYCGSFVKLSLGTL